jgi:hypothetical protein
VGIDSCSARAWIRDSVLGIFASASAAGGAVRVPGGTN